MNQFSLGDDDDDLDGDFSFAGDDDDDDLEGDDYEGSGLLGWDDDLSGDFSLAGRSKKKRRPKKSTAMLARQKLQNAQLAKALKSMQKRQALMQKSMASLQPSQQTQILPFPTAAGGGATVAAGATNTVFANPQRPFQTERFVWGSATSAFFRILQLTIGQENMFVQAGTVPAEIFSQTGVGVGLRGYIAYPGIDITLQVQNTDAAAHPIDASILGATLV